MNAPHIIDSTSAGLYLAILILTVTLPIAKVILEVIKDNWPF
jgi:hypothetical protein